MTDNPVTPTETVAPTANQDKSDYFSYNRQLLATLIAQLPAALDSVCSQEQKQELLTQLEHTAQCLDTGKEEGRHHGQNWLFTFIGNHPQLTPIIPRDLLWFFGGDCLHFLSDQEIDRYQRIEDTVASHPENPVSWAEVRRQAFNQ